MPQSTMMVEGIHQAGREGIYGDDYQILLHSELYEYGLHQGKSGWKCISSQCQHHFRLFGSTKGR